ncbi:hypothetical protein OAG24_00050 [bacterium]|nr:hypothetical protein [bacterium]
MIEIVNFEYEKFNGTNSVTLKNNPIHIYIIKIKREKRDETKFFTYKIYDGKECGFNITKFEGSNPSDHDIVEIIQDKKLIKKFKRIIKFFSRITSTIENRKI